MNAVGAVLVAMTIEVNAAENDAMIAETIDAMTEEVKAVEAIDATNVHVQSETKNLHQLLAEIEPLDVHIFNEKLQESLDVKENRAQKINALDKYVLIKKTRFSPGHFY